MKSLKDILNEGILADIDDAIVNMDNAVKEYNKFGNNFEIIDFKVDNKASYSKLNSRILRSMVLANKGNFKSINAPICFGHRGHWSKDPKCNEKMNIFIAWLDHLDISDFRGYNYNTKEFTDKFEQYLNEQCQKDKVFNNEQTYVKIMSYYRKDPSIWDYNRFTIGITSSKSSHDGKSLWITCKAK